MSSKSLFETKKSTKVTFAKQVVAVIFKKQHSHTIQKYTVDAS